MINGVFCSLRLCSKSKIESVRFLILPALLTRIAYDFCLSPPLLSKRRFCLPISSINLSLNSSTNSISFGSCPLLIFCYMYFSLFLYIWVHLLKRLNMEFSLNIWNIFIYDYCFCISIIHYLDKLYIHLIYIYIYIHIYIYIYIYIYIMSFYQDGYFWPSLVTPLNCPLLPAGPQVYIPHRHRAALCRFELDVLPLLVHVKGQKEYITYELVPTSPAVSRTFSWWVMSGKWWVVSGRTAAAL